MSNGYKILYKLIVWNNGLQSLWWWLPEGLQTNREVLEYAVKGSIWRQYEEMNKFELFFLSKTRREKEQHSPLIKVWTLHIHVDRSYLNVQAYDLARSNIV